MKLKTHEDVLAATAAVNARVRSWRPDNRRSQAAVMADYGNLLAYQTTLLTRGVEASQQGILGFAEGEADALRLASTVMHLASAGADAEATAGFRTTFAALDNARKKRLADVVCAGEGIVRELHAVGALDAALGAELGKAAP